MATVVGKPNMGGMVGMVGIVQMFGIISMASFVNIGDAWRRVKTRYIVSGASPRWVCIVINIVH